MSLASEEQNFQQINKCVFQLLDKAEYKTGITLNQIQQFLYGKVNRLPCGLEVKTIMEKLVKNGNLVNVGNGKFILNEAISNGARTAGWSRKRRSHSRRRRRSKSRRRQPRSPSRLPASRRRRSRSRRPRMLSQKTARRNRNWRQRSSGSSSPESAERRQRSNS